MSQPEHPARGNTHVFVIDGSPDVLALLRELLQEECYTVTTTNFVPRTWDRIAALQPDLLMVDLAVDYRDGWELLERLRREPFTRNIPVIVFSTNPNLLKRAERQADRYGGQRFFVKPFDVDELMTAVSELVGSAESDEPPTGRAATH